MEITTDFRNLILETRRVRLRGIRSGDLPILLQWRNSEKFRLLLHYNTDEISYDEFFKEFTLDSEYYKYRLIIERKENELPIGLIYTDTFSDQYKSCFINVFMAEPFEKKGYGVDAFVLLALFLFKCEGLKKLFAHAFDFNDHSLSCIRNIGMRELVGNVTRVPQRGNILCFAADESIVPKLAEINKILSTHKSSFLKQ